MGVLGMAKAGFEDTFAKIQQLQALKLQRTQKQHDELTAVADDPQWQMQASDEQKSLALDTINGYRQRMNLPTLNELQDAVSPAFMADVANLRTKLTMPKLERKAYLKAKYGAWLPKNYVRFKDQLTVASAMNGTATAPVAATVDAKPAAAALATAESAYIPGKVPGQAPPDAMLTSGPAAPLPATDANQPLQTASAPVDELDAALDALVGDYIAPLTPAQRIAKAAQGRVDVAKGYEAGFSAEDMLHARMETWDTENPGTPFDPDYLAEGNSPKKRKEQSDFYFKLRTELGKVGEAGRQGIVNTAIDQGLPESYVRDLQTMPAIPQKDAAAEGHKDTAELDRFIVNTGKWLADAYQSPANPATIDFDTLSTRQAFWQAKQVRENPGTTAADWPKDKMPDGFGRHGAMKVAESRRLEDTDQNRAIAQQRVTNQINQFSQSHDLHERNYQIALDKANKAGPAGGMTPELKAAQLTDAEKKLYGPLFGTKAKIYAPQSVREHYKDMVESINPSSKEPKFKPGAEANFKALSVREELAHPDGGVAPKAEVKAEVTETPNDSATGGESRGPDTGKTYSGIYACGNYVKDVSGFHGTLENKANQRGTGKTAAMHPGNAVHTDEGSKGTHWVYITKENTAVDWWGGKPRERSIEDVRPHIKAVYAIPGSAKQPAKKPVKMAAAAKMGGKSKVSDKAVLNALGD